MRKESNKLFTYFSVLTMLVGFFLPNYTYIVNAMEGDLDTGSEIPFTNVDNGVIYLDMEENNSKVITLDNAFGSFETCSSSSPVVTSFEDGKCTVTAEGYGKSFVTFYYLADGEDKEETYIVDIESGAYFDYILNKLPKEHEYTRDFSKDNIEERISKLLPNGFSYSFDDERNTVKDEWGNDVDTCSNYLEGNNKCYGSLIYEYHVNFSEQDSIVAEFVVTIKDDETDEDNNYGDGIGFIQDQYVNVGETKEIELSGIAYDNSNNYFWVSDDNNIARMNTKNQLVGVTPGVTTIKLINKKTFEYIEFDVHVDPSNSKRPLEDLKNLFSGTVEIDVSNLSSFDGTPNGVLTYFNKLGKSVDGVNSIYANSITCMDGLNGCVIDFYYYDNNSNYIEDQTPTFNIVYRGLGINGFNDGYMSVNGKYYITMNGNQSFYLNNFEEETPNIVYDESYINLVPGEYGLYTINAIKEGNTKIEFFVDGYMNSINLEILFKQDDVIELRNFYNNLKEINVPFSMEDANVNLIESYVEAYIKDSLKNNDVAKYIKVKVVELKDKDIQLDLYVDYNGKVLMDYMFYEKFVNLKYNLVSDESTYKALETLKATIKDEYTASLNGSIYLANEYTGDDFYNTLINQVSLMRDANSSNGLFTVQAVYGGAYKYNKYLLGGVYYNIYIYKDEVLVGVDRTYINTNFLIDRNVLDEGPESDIEYISKIVKDATGEEYIVEKVVDNYYRVNGKNSFNVIYDHKEKVLAEETKVYLGGDTLIDLDVGEEYQLELLFNPFTATYSNTTFHSSDTSVFTVDANGKITAQGKGHAILSFGDARDLSYYLVVVGYEGNEFIEYLIDELNMGKLVIDYADAMIWDDEKELLANRILNLLVRKYDIDYLGIYSFDVQVVKDNGSYKYIACISDICSDKHEFDYEYVGIYAEPGKLELNVGQSEEVFTEYFGGDLSDIRYAVVDKDVAKVDKNGKVTAVGTGRTYLKIYDKKHTYVYHVPIEVEIDKHINKLIEEVKDKTYDIDYVVGEGYSYERELGYALSTKLYEDGYDFDYVIYGNEPSNQYHFMYDAENNKFTFVYSVEDKEYEVTTNINFVGIAVESEEYDVAVAETIMLSYATLDGGKPTFKSLNTDVCVIDEDEYGTSIIRGVKPGFCTVTLSHNGYKKDVDIVVGREDIEASIFDDIKTEDEITLKLDQYDVSKRSDPGYNEMYESAVINYFRNMLLGKENYDFAVSSVGASENGDEITLELYYCNYDVGYGVCFEDEERTIEIEYSGRSDNWEGLAEELGSIIKDKYILTNDQMMQYMLDYDNESNAFRGMFPYSDFVDDIKDVCSDCNLVQFGWGSTDGNLGVIEEGFHYMIFKDDEPIYSGNVNLEGSFIVDVEDMDDYDKFEHSLKRRFHDAYKRNKDKHKIPGINIFFEGTTKEEEEEFEYPVELKYIDSSGDAMIYEVSIDGRVFDATITVNFVENGELPDEPKVDPIIKVEKITLNKENLNLEVGKSFKLVATVSPDNATNKKVKWSSSNEKVVKVVDGNVTAVGVGTATITVVSEDGNAKVSLNVSVIKAGIAGDIDGDGKVNIKDLVLLRKHLAEISILKGAKKDAADFNKDGKVNVKDLVNMRTYLSK